MGNVPTFFATKVRMTLLRKKPTTKNSGTSERYSTVVGFVAASEIIMKTVYAKVKPCTRQRMVS